MSRLLDLLLESDGAPPRTARRASGSSSARGPTSRSSISACPLMSGFELERRIRANADNAGSLLVALSGYGQNADVQASLTAGEAARRGAAVAHAPGTFSVVSLKKSHRVQLSARAGRG